MNLMESLKQDVSQKVIGAEVDDLHAPNVKANVKIARIGIARILIMIDFCNRAKIANAWFPVKIYSGFMQRYNAALIITLKKDSSLTIYSIPVFALSSEYEFDKAGKSAVIPQTGD